MHGVTQTSGAAYLASVFSFPSSSRSSSAVVTVQRYLRELSVSALCFLHVYIPASCLWDSMCTYLVLPLLSMPANMFQSRILPPVLLSGSQGHFSRGIRHPNDSLPW